MNFSNVSTVDIVVLSVLVVSGILAFRRGFVREIFALGTWIAATVIAASYYPDLKPWVVKQGIKDNLTSEAAAAILLFCGTLIILIPLGTFIADLIKGPTLTALNRSLGLVFGLVRGLLVLCLVFLCFMLIWPLEEGQPEWLKSPKSRPVLAYGAEILQNLVPKDEQEKIAERLRKSKERAEKNMEDAKRLEIISTPVPGSGKTDNMDEIVDQKSEP